jgi:hypothetical protein
LVFSSWFLGSFGAGEGDFAEGILVKKENNLDWVLAAPVEGDGDAAVPPGAGELLGEETERRIAKV